ncbi:hypothetical protein ACM66B_003257 [Microbotryomycetes sp. NB124-2]
MLDMSLRTCLVYQDLGDRADDLIDQLRRHFDKVTYYPVDGFRDLIPSDPLPTPDELASTDVLFAVRLPLSLTSISQLPRLRLLQILVSGTTHITSSSFFSSISASIHRQSLTISSGAGLQSGAIAEHVLGVTLSLRLGLTRLVCESRKRKEWVVDQSLGLRRPELRGAKVGILGYGAIGRECARLFTAFGCHVTACTRSGFPSPLSTFQHPYLGDPTSSLPRQFYSSTNLESFKKFVETNDVVVVSLPSSKTNHKLIGIACLSWMKNDAILINVGRGDVVDTDALVDALKAGCEADLAVSDEPHRLQIGAAAVDVTDPEPLPRGHALYSLPNAIVTPHCAGLSINYAERGVQLMLNNVEALRAGQRDKVINLI